MPPWNTLQKLKEQGERRTWSTYCTATKLRNIRTIVTRITSAKAKVGRLVSLTSSPVCRLHSLVPYERVIAFDRGATQSRLVKRQVGLYRPAKKTTLLTRSWSLKNIHLPYGNAAFAPSP